MKAYIAQVFADRTSGIKEKLGSKLGNDFEADDYRRSVLENKIVVFMSCAFQNVAFEAGNKSFVESCLPRQLNNNEFNERDDRDGQSRQKDDVLLGKLAAKINLGSKLKQEVDNKQRMQNVQSAELPKELIDAKNVKSTAWSARAVAA